MSSQNGRSGAAGRNRRALLMALIAVVIVGVVGVVYALTRGGQDTGATRSPGQLVSSSAPNPSQTSGVPSSSVTNSQSVSNSPSRGPTATPVPKPSVPAATATGKPTVVPPRTVPTTRAPIDKKSQLGNGVSVKVSKLESVKGEAQGPGEIAGPALRISVRVDNGTKKAIAMDLALVNVYYGKDKSPAQALSGPGVVPFRAPIRAGGSGTGTYVFGIPVKQRQNIDVEFSYTTNAPTVIFSGSA